MEEAWIAAAMFVNSQPTKRAQVDAILAGRSDQAIHLGNKLRYNIHISLYTPLPV